jgi:hypothetical protein
MRNETKLDSFADHSDRDLYILIKYGKADLSFSRFSIGVQVAASMILGMAGIGAEDPAIKAIAFGYTTVLGASVVYNIIDYGRIQADLTAANTARLLRERLSK